MNTAIATTEAVIRNHLHAFVAQRGVDAIVSDYHDDARLYTEARIYEGKEAIRGFFVDFIASLPEGVVNRFLLKALHVDRDLAFITWNAGADVPLGTDTFLVRDGRIVSQTFAMATK